MSKQVARRLGVSRDGGPREPREARGGPLRMPGTDQTVAEVLAAALAEVPQPPVARVRPPGAAQRPTLSSLPKRTPPHEEPLVSGPPFRSPRQQQQWLLQEKRRLMEEMRAGHLAELEARSYEG